MNATVPIPEILRAHADAHARNAASLPGGARWQARRSQALERLMRLGLPTTHDEAWKYAPLRELAALAVDPARTAPAASAEPSSTPFSVPGARRLVFIDGRLAQALSDEPAAIDDLQAVFLPDLLRTSPDALLARLPAATDLPEDRFALMNESFLSDGISIRVPQGAAPAPLHLQFVAASSEHAVHPRILIEVGAGAQLQLIEQHSTQSASRTVDNAVTQIELHEGAKLEHYLLLDAGTQGRSLHGSYLTQRADSHLIQHRVLLGGELARTSLQSQLTGRAAAIEFSCRSGRPRTLRLQRPHRGAGWRGGQRLAAVEPRTAVGAGRGDRLAPATRDLHR